MQARPSLLVAESFFPYWYATARSDYMEPFRGSFLHKVLAYLSTRTICRWYATQVSKRAKAKCTVKRNVYQDWLTDDRIPLGKACPAMVFDRVCCQLRLNVLMRSFPNNWPQDSAFFPRLFGLAIPSSSCKYQHCATAWKGGTALLIDNQQKMLCKFSSQRVICPHNQASRRVSIEAIVGCA